jgi:hypothetical protein
VELAAPTPLTEIQFSSTAAGGRGGGPGRGQAAGPGRGAAAAADAEAAPAAPPVLGFPRGYKVEVSMDGSTWSSPVAQGRGTGATTVITFAPVQAKFVRLTETENVDAVWSIQNLRLYRPGSVR